MTTLFNPDFKRMLHVAPEACFENKLKKKLFGDYISIDLYKPTVMFKMDVTNLIFPNESFDVIYCSHVLEHVLDDRLAMREFCRVLKPQGWAILLVPVLIDNANTFEAPSVTDPAERARLFGQFDHVRYYGRDYVNRLEDAGFNVKVVKATDFLSIDEIERMGIYLTEAAGEIYYCTKKKMP
jgi:predicted SAM-dependent methyltransferase